MTGAAHHPPRSSPDLSIDARGRALLGLLGEIDLTVVNGTLGPASARFTSHQGQGQSVIDLLIANAEAREAITCLTVEDRLPEWSDHSLLSVALSLEHVEALDSAPRVLHNRNAGPPPPLPTETHLDRLFVNALYCRADPSDSLTRFFGYASVTTHPVMVYTDGACTGNGARGASAGSGAFWGENNPLNASARTPGPGQTNNRGELFAILISLRDSDPEKSLHITSDSEYAITASSWNAPRAAQLNWDVPNGDIVMLICNRIQRRSAPVRLSYTKAHANCLPNEQADALAKLGARLLAVPDLHCPTDLRWSHPHELLEHGVPKLVVDIPHPRQPTLPLPIEKPNTPAAAGENPVLAKKRQNLNDLLAAAPFAARFWELYRHLNDPSRAASKSSLTASEIMSVFARRMNPLQPVPASFDHVLQELDALRASLIPLRTVDLTPEQFFDAPITQSDLTEMRQHRRAHAPGETTGQDGVTDSDIEEMEDSALIELANACFEQRDSPTVWLIIIVYAILKRGKSLTSAEDLRTIGAESKALKAFTFLALLRTVRWTEARGILPPSQNGFRKGYRTTNNVFILRCLIDKARSLGKPLYVATIDITNAFPSTNRPTLWLKLKALGMQGRIYDWLRALYTSMRYVVRNNGEDSAVFESTIGILIGDTLSPLLFSIYLSDFTLDPDRDDLDLEGRFISHLEHADDLLLTSLSPEGLQKKMNSFYHWCRENFMVINALKSSVCIHGPRPRTMPQFRFSEEIVDVVPQYTYLGVTLRSDTRNVFAEHYKIKARKSSAAAHAVLHIDAMVENLPPKAGRTLYMARIDPILTYGCEVMPDVDPALTDLLSDVQTMYLRRILGVHNRSVLAPLYTETNVDPLKFRRIDIALRFLGYALNRPPETYVRAALNECISLTAAGQQGWLMDLQLAILQLRGSVRLPDLLDLTTEAVERCRTQVLAAMREDLQSQIDTNKKLYLLRNRKGPVLALRRYLLLENAQHRETMTQILLSCHGLAVERLRWPQRYRAQVDYDDRLCRLCLSSVETPEHVLLVCTANSQITELRSSFLTELQSRGDMLPTLTAASDPIPYLRRILSLEDCLDTTARWMFETVETLQTVDMYFPSAYLLTA